MAGFDEDAHKLTRARALLRSIERLLGDVSTDVAAATELHLNQRIRHLAGKGLENPKTITDEEVRELCGEILRHVRRMEGGG